ncbi:Transposase DDE domain-containing protein, partial [Staphylococcus hominis]
WEYFKAQINKKLSEPKIKTIYSQRKIDVEPVFGFMKAILGFTRMSVRGINKAKRELGFVLMALNIRKVTAQRAENNQKNYKKDNFYIISIEIVFFHLSRYFMSRTQSSKFILIYNNYFCKSANVRPLIDVFLLSCLSRRSCFLPFFLLKLPFDRLFLLSNLLFRLPPRLD